MEETSKPLTRRDALAGCLLGGAIGDALGLPFEGLSPTRRDALFGSDLTTGYRFVGRRGMVSDDTEHAAMTARALCLSGGDSVVFASRLAAQLRGWILLLPAGVGLATLRACFRLLAGISPDNSGVFSAGNGPAMRAAIIGVAWGHDAHRLRRLVRASSRLTHSDPKAEWGALIAAWAAYAAFLRRATHSNDDAENGAFSFTDALASLPLEAGELCDLVRQAEQSVQRGETTEAFARSMGVGEKGVGGYIFQTVPVALHAAWRFPGDVRAAVHAALSCGGDTDTVGAITGGIVGAGVGRAAIPSDLVRGLWEGPGQTPHWLDRVADALAQSVETKQAQPAPFINVLVRALRNLLFLIIVIAHGLRRLLPPY